MGVKRLVRPFGKLSGRTSRVSAASFGLLFLGALIGFVSAWGAASLGAKARIIEHDERHQDELDRIASVQLQREEAIRRGHPVEYPDEPLNRW